MRELTITTPEHVNIRLEPAGSGSRFLAVLIDAFITTAIASVIFTVLVNLLPRLVAAAIFVTVSFILTWGWHVYFEVKKHGRTPGKRALSLRVVDARGLPVTLYQSMVRNMARIVDFLPAFYGVGALVSMLRSDRRRLGDILADTLVIRESQPLAYRGELGAERHFNPLRTPRALRLIRHRVSLEEREFLLALCLRAQKMSPAARYDLMEEVAKTYRQKLDIEEEAISGENLVRDLTAVLFSRMR
jgi:uncharacterized RDD family membrane protein YckC